MMNTCNEMSAFAAVMALTIDIWCALAPSSGGCLPWKVVLTFQKSVIRLRRFVFSGGGSLADSVKGPSDHMSSGPLPEPEGSGPKTEPPQPSQQLVYVFTTSLANR